VAYTTTAAVKLLLGIPTASTGDDALLADLIAQAQDAIDLYCHRTFEAAGDTTKYADAVADVSGRTLTLPVDLAQVGTITNGDGTEITSGQYVTEPRNATPYYAITLKASTGIDWTYTDDPENAIAIEGRWAYSVTAPSAIVRATNRLAAFMYNQRGQSTDMDRPVVSQSGTVLLPAGLPRDVAELIEHLVRR